MKIKVDKEEYERMIKRVEELEEDYEVIGNIHQNPELLEVKDVD